MFYNFGYFCSPSRPPLPNDRDKHHKAVFIISLRVDLVNVAFLPFRKLDKLQAKEQGVDVKKKKSKKEKKKKRKKDKESGW